MGRSTPKRNDLFFENCPVIFSLNILGKKWMVPIICELKQNSVMRFGDFLRALDGITSVMLTQSLKDLQGLGIVTRIQYNEIPLRVEYSLTEMGRELLPSIYGLARWSVCMDAANGKEARICKNDSCPAHAIHLLDFNWDEISNAYQQWDRDFLSAMDELDQTPAEQEMDPFEKLCFLMEYTLARATECGEEQSRLRTMYYIIGDNRSQDLVEEGRPAYRILRKLLAEGRAHDLITDEMEDAQIIASFMAYRHGLLASWELERGSYDIVEKNRVPIRVFINSFRKRKG